MPEVNLYVCCICGAGHVSNPSLVEHLCSGQGEGGHGMEYGSVLVRAILSHERRWPCFCCSTTLSTWRALQDHLSAAHGLSGTLSVDHELGLLPEQENWQTMIAHWLPQRQDEDHGNFI